MAVDREALMRESKVYLVEMYLEAEAETDAARDEINELEDKVSELEEELGGIVSIEDAEDEVWSDLQDLIIGIRRGDIQRAQEILHWKLPLRYRYVS